MQTPGSAIYKTRSRQKDLNSFQGTIRSLTTLSLHDLTLRVNNNNEKSNAYCLHLPTIKETDIIHSNYSTMYFVCVRVSFQDAEADVTEADNKPQQFKGTASRSVAGTVLSQPDITGILKRRNVATLHEEKIAVSFELNLRIS